MRGLISVIKKSMEEDQSIAFISGDPDQIKSIILIKTAEATALHATTTTLDQEVANEYMHDRKGLTELCVITARHKEDSYSAGTSFFVYGEDFKVISLYGAMVVMAFSYINVLAWLPFRVLSIFLGATDQPCVSFPIPPDLFEPFQTVFVNGYEISAIQMQEMMAVPSPIDYRFIDCGPPNGDWLQCSPGAHVKSIYIAYIDYELPDTAKDLVDWGSGQQSCKIHLIVPDGLDVDVEGSKNVNILEAYPPTWAPLEEDSDEEAEY